MSETNSFRSQELATDLPRANGDATAKIIDTSGYALLDRIGVGGMGEVYRFGDEALQRDLAIKILKEELRGNADAEERFLREARLTGSLQHPGIVPIHNLSRLADGRPCYTMKLVRGRTFADMLRDEPQGPERLPRLLAILEKVCQAVAYAHSKHVIHRDLKPSNVMVGEFGEVQVMDWGLAKELHVSELPPPPEATEDVETAAWTKEADGLSRAGSALGTPAYMPPEQAAGDWDIVDERADVFALGAILCEMLTGKPPYHGASRDDLLRRARRGDMAEALSRLEKCGADAVLVDLCRECLSAERLQRPRHAGVVAERLASYQAEVRERLRQSELERARAEVKALEERKRRRLLVALALAALVLMAGGAAGWWQWQQRRAKADGAVELALGEARSLWEQAQKDVLTAAGYDKAVAAAHNAVEIAGAGGASEGMRQKAETLFDEIEQESKAAAKDRRLLAALLEVYSPREGPKYGRNDNGMMIALTTPTMEEQFASAFRDWGLDMEAVPISEAVTRLKVRPAAVVTEVIAALDEWASQRRLDPKAGKQWQRLAELAAALDDNPGSLRRELRGIMARRQLPLGRALSVLSAALRPVPVPLILPLGKDHLRLRQLAERTDAATEPVLGLMTLTRALGIAGDEALAARLLRAALTARPREVAPYCMLGHMLAQQNPPRWAEAVEFYRAARGLRPDLGFNLSWALLHSGHEEEAQALLERFVRGRPEAPKLYWLFGWSFYYKQGKLAEAEAAFRKAIALQPDYATAYHTLGLALADQGKIVDAEAAYRKAISLKPDVADVYVNLGGLLNDRRGKHVEAEELFRKAIALAPNDAVAYNNLGIALAGQGKHVDAEVVCRKAIALKPDDAFAYNVLGDALNNQHKPVEAEAALRKAIALKPDYANAYGNLGSALYRQGKPVEAEAAYRKVIALKPDDARAYYSLGIALSRQGKHEAAAAAFRNAIELKADDPYVYFQLGIALYGRRKLAGAEEAWRKAIALKPDYTEAYNGLGGALISQGKPVEAEAVLRKAIALKSDYAEAYGNLGAALQGQDKLAKAEVAYRKAITLKPDNAVAYSNLGQLLHRREKPQEAEAACHKALALKPDFAAAYNNLGNSLYSQGKYAEAASSYRKAIALKPDDTVAYSNLGAALSQQGKNAEAEDAFRKVIALKPDDSVAYVKLGTILNDHEWKHADAEALYRKAIALKPDYDEAYNDLGYALNCQGKSVEAETVLRKAIALQPGYALAYGNLGSALRGQGRFTESLAAYRRCHELGSKQRGWRFSSLQWVRDAERMVEWEKKLPAVLQGKAAPANVSDAIILTWMCRQPYKKRYATSARLYATAFALDPKFAADMTEHHRYYAACSAAMAAAGQGEDARLLPDKVAAMFRNWALGWLRDHLSANAKLAEQNKADERKAIHQRLSYWLRDPELASVRDPQALDRLPDNERAAWQALWRDVDELAKRASKTDESKP